MCPLLRELYKHFSWHPARLECFSLMITGIIESCGVRLKDMARFCGSAQPSSKIQRVYRFLREQVIDYNALSKLLLSLVKLDNYVFTMDRSNWKLGNHETNILFLGIIIGSVSVPLCWVTIGRPGMSDTAQRKQLLQQAIDIVGINKIDYFLADREFMGKEWLQYLSEQQIRYVIPLKGNTNATIGNKKLLRVDKIFAGLPQSHYEHKAANLYKTDVILAAYRNGKGELMVLACSHSLGAEPFVLYKKRWTIERLFKHLKTGGFNMEDSHVLIAERWEKLIAAMAVATIIVVKQGVIKDSTYPIPIKKTLGRAAYSVFTYGLDSIKNTFKSAPDNIAKTINNILNYNVNIELVLKV